MSSRGRVTSILLKERESNPVPFSREPNTLAHSTTPCICLFTCSPIVFGSFLSFPDVKLKPWKQPHGSCLLAMGFRLLQGLSGVEKPGKGF
jgi:hypothetical protein